MLHAVTLSYVGAEETLQPHLDAHKKWLVENIQNGSLILAGPLVNGKGGFLLVHKSDQSALTAFLESDPFVKQGLVTVHVQSVIPAVCSDKLTLTGF